MHDVSFGFQFDLRLTLSEIILKTDTDSWGTALKIMVDNQVEK